MSKMYRCVTTNDHRSAFSVGTVTTEENEVSDRLNEDGDADVKTTTISISHNQYTIYSSNTTKMNLRRMMIIL